MMRLSTARSWLLLAGLGVLAPFACAPSSDIPSSTHTFDTTSAGGGSGVGGYGGGFLEAGPSCDDPADPDGDLVANSLELAPSQDTDGDGTPDAQDDDSDGDGVKDAVEAVNPRLDPGQPGQSRSAACDPLADTDGDGTPDLRDLDSDNDGVSDAQEEAYDPGDKLGCRVLVDCDGDGVIDVVEAAAGSSPTDAKSKPDDPGLYFVLPYKGGERTQDFDFSTGIAKADIYFLVDTTASMQPAIDDLKASIDTEILPTILNGDPNATPPIPAITDAWIGVGDFRDVPWGGYGQPGDSIYRNRFGNDVGNVAAPVPQNGGYVAPPSVETILSGLTAAGGGDGPEATTQALWIAATNQPYAATIGGVWSPAPPYPVTCSDPGMFGVPCFRPQSIPIFVVVSDAPFHNGPVAQNAYNPMTVGQTKSYAETVDALNAIHASVVGVPVAGGNPGAARSDLTDLAKQTGSMYHDPAFGGVDKPLVPETDVSSGKVSTEVVRLLGLLAGAGLHDVTTTHTTYDCAGNVDCTGDGAPDLEYHNPTVPPDAGPFDAAKLITSIEPVPSAKMPLPYASLDATTFHGVNGDAHVTFRVHAKNDLIDPPSLLVLRALVRVQTPSGQLLGGKAGIRLVYFVIPEYIPTAK